MIGLVGATGFTGSLCARELHRRGLPTVWIARSAERMAALATELGPTVEQRVATPTDEDGLRRALDRCTVVLDTVGPFTELGEPVVKAAIARTAHYVDTTGEQGFMAAMLARHDAAARAAGVAVISACAYEYALGECAAALAVVAIGQPCDVDVYYFVRGAGVSQGTAKSALRVAAQGGVRWEGGALVPERIEHGLISLPGEEMPRSVISVPAGEALHLRGNVRSVRTWMGFSAKWVPWLALRPLLPALRVGAMQGLADRWVDARLTEPTAKDRAASRFTVVARARAGDTVVWRRMDGVDPYGITAVIAVEAAARLAGGAPNETGVVSVARAFDPAAFLASVGLPAI